MILGLVVFGLVGIFLGMVGIVLFAFLSISILDWVDEKFCKDNGDAI